MDNYEDKLLYLLTHQKHECPICEHWLGLSQPIDLHHQFSNTKWGKKKYPLFINSVLNLVAVHSECHLNHCSLRITDYNANRYEKFLECHKKSAIFVNSP